MNKLAIITTALTAGLFFGFVVAINPAFAHLPDSTYITAMQAINKAIVNPVFALAFFGPVILIPIVAYKRKSRLLWLAAAFYIIGGIGVTYAVNVPLNNLLATGALERHAFDKPWNQWHLVRTLAVIISLVLQINR
jgi:uncharacterized membrane protein